jgi:hypothetical protein
VLLIVASPSNRCSCPRVHSQVRRLPPLPDWRAAEADVSRGSRATAGRGYGQQDDYGGGPPSPSHAAAAAAAAARASGQAAGDAALRVMMAAAVQRQPGRAGVGAGAAASSLLDGSQTLRSWHPDGPGSPSPHGLRRKASAPRPPYLWFGPPEERLFPTGVCTPTSLLTFPSSPACLPACLTDRSSAYAMPERVTVLSCMLALRAAPLGAVG